MASRLAIESGARTVSEIVRARRGRASHFHRRRLAFRTARTRQLHPVRDAQLAIDPREMVLDGLQSQPEAIGNLLIGATVREECHDLPLARREPPHTCRRTNRPLHQFGGVRLRTYAGNCRGHHEDNSDKLPAGVKSPWGARSGDESCPQSEKNELKSSRNAELRVKC